MKKGVISVNSNAEKTIIAMTISVVLAIIFDGKRKSLQSAKALLSEFQSTIKLSTI